MSPLAPALRRGLFLAPEFHRTDITKESGDKKFARSLRSLDLSWHASRAPLELGGAPLPRTPSKEGACCPSLALPRSRAIAVLYSQR